MSRQGWRAKNKRGVPFKGTTTDCKSQRRVQNPNRILYKRKICLSLILSSENNRTRN
jgi:hypothetical protein